MSAAQPIAQSFVEARPRLRTFARALAGPAILLVIVTCFFWKLVLTDQYSWLQAPDLSSQVVPWYQFEATQFHMHRFPLWDPFLWGGQSLIGQAQPGLAYPPNWILFSLPLNHGHISFTALNWYYMLIHYFAALFCYLLCRDLGRSMAASILGGVAFGLGGYVANTDWPQMINGAIWGPLVFLFLFRAARGLRPFANAAFSGLFLGISWLSGHHQIPIFLTLAAGAVWLYYILREGRINWRLVGPAALFCAFLFFTGALMTWPAAAYGHYARRWVGVEEPISWNEPVPYTVHEQYSLSPIYLLGLIIPGYQGASQPFVGVAALALAGLALAWWWKTREVRVLTAVGIAGLLLALAKNDVFHGILYSIVPMFEKARSPGTAIYLFQFAIAVLMAFGLDALMQPSAKPLVRRLTLILLAFGTLTFVIIFAVDLGKSLNWNFDDRVVMSSLAAFALAGLLYRARRGDSAHPGVLALIIGLYMIELGNVSLYYLPNKVEKGRNEYLKPYTTTESIANYLRSQPSPIRVEINNDDVHFNFGDWHGIDTTIGHVAGLPENILNAEIHTPRTKSLYGVGYTISKNPTMPGQQEVFRNDQGLAVYKNPDVLPRVWTVHDWVKVKDVRDAQAHLQSAAFDLRTRTFGYAAPPPMDACQGDTVRSFNRGINSTTAVVDMKCRGMLIESENYAPGWTARVDGRKTPVYEAYGVLRGVVVPPGVHKVELRFRPASVVGGAISTLLAFLGALAFCIFPRRKTIP